MTRLAVSLLLLGACGASASAIEFHLQDAEAPESSSDAVVDQVSPEQGTPAEDVSLGECCCDCCCPSWTANIGYVYLWRERTGSDFAILEDAADNPLFTADRFDFDAKSGMDVSVMRDNGCGRGLQVRYLGLEQYSASETVDLGAFRAATNPNQTSATIFSAYTHRLESELHSIELLTSRCCGNMQVFGGFRYISLEERLSSIAVNNLPPSLFFEADNDLYGFELGANGELWNNCRCLSIEGLAKVGIYHNDVSASALDTDTASGGSGQASGSETAFASELAVTAVYDVRCNLSLRAGYQMLFIDGVALAADQVPNTGDLNVGLNNADVRIDSSSIFFHGLNVGLEYRR